MSSPRYYESRDVGETPVAACCMLCVTMMIVMCFFRVTTNSSILAVEMGRAPDVARRRAIPRVHSEGTGR